MLLPSAEFASNNTVSSTTKKSPFSLVLTYNPSLNVNLPRETQAGDSETARQRASNLESANREAVTLWNRATDSMTRYYNKRRKEKSYSPGDLVMLNSKHIRTRRASRKLDDRFIGPFEVLKTIGQNAYTLRLPTRYGRLHNTFHVSLLEPYRMREGREIPAPIEIDGEEEWEIEQILDHKDTAQGTQYLVKWKGFSTAENTWEPVEHLLNASEELARYRAASGIAEI